MAVSCQTGCFARAGADEEAVHPDELAGSIGLDVALFGLSGRLVGCCVAGDEGEALPAGREPVTAQRAPDAVLRDAEAAPLTASELRGHALGPEAGVGEREGDDPLLDHLRQGVWHLWALALSGPQHLQAVALNLPSPAVVGRAVDAEGPTGLCDRRREAWAKTCWR